ncbi:MAG: OmpH/Skp family outer membrane protein [Planctomycetota bacterium]|jgi:Skp family chaperone for outer membrane proteins
MYRNTQRFNLPMVMLALALGTIAAYQALAQRGAGISPPIIAAVRIEPLFDGLQQRAEAKMQISALEDDLVAEQGRRQEALNAKELELEDVVAATRREELGDEIGLERLKHQFWFQEAQAELEVDKAVRLQNLYRSIKKAIAEMAEAEGYDMVVLNDSSDDVPFDREVRVPAQIQILQQITNRKILYLKPTIDVTDDLIVRMNNEFRAGQSGAGER